MIRALCSLVAIASAVSSQTVRPSPCPNVFTYEPPEAGEKLDPGTAKWYGTITLSTDITLHALWLNIIVDNKASILGNWVGEVTTEDNLNFKIENTKMKLTPGTPLLVRFFVQYNTQDIEPKLLSILFNGRDICNVEESPEVIVAYPISIPDSYDGSNEVPVRRDATTTVRSTVLTTRNIYDRSQTTSQYRQTTTTKPSFWFQTKTTQATTEKIQSKYEAAKNENKTQATSNIWNWVQPKLDNTQQEKPASNLETKNKDQTFSTISQTQTKPQSWSQNRTASDQTKNVTKVSSAQSTWSSKATDRQQIKSEKFQTTTESNYRVTSYTKPQTWSSVKAESNQPSIIDKRLEANEDKTKFQLFSQIKVDNENIKTVDKQTSQSSYGFQSTTANIYNKGEVWSDSSQQTKSKDTQNKPDDRSQYYSQYNENNNPQTDDRPVIYEDTSYVQSTQQRKSGSTSNIDKSQKITQAHIPDSQYKQDSISFQLAGRRPEESVEIKSVPNRDDGIFEVSPIRRKENIANRPIDTYSWSQDKPKIIFESSGSTNNNEEDGIRNINVRQPSSNGYQLTTARPTPTAAGRPAVDDTYDADYPTKFEDKDTGLVDLPVFYIPNLRPEASCGTVTKKPPRFLPESSSTSEGQWPWQAALYQQQTVDFKYICGGTLVSHRHVITAAHCVTRKKSRREVNKNTLTVYLGKFNLRTSVDGVQVRFVNKIIIHPAYNATIFSRDLAILELREQVSYTDWVRPVCLWPENEVGLRNIVGKRGSVVGWGYDVTGAPREELNLLEMPVVDQTTCISSYIEFYEKFTSDYTYCAGYNDGTSVCNGDSGGGMVFKKGSSWYLRGLASLSIARQNEYRCNPKHYVIFTDIAKFLPWIEENIPID